MKRILASLLSCLLLFGTLALPATATGTEETIKILGIGNSFTQNSVTYLRQFAQGGGVDMLVASATIGGCSLETHWNNAESGAEAYSYAKRYTSTETITASLETALLDEDWDYIVLQQVSQLSGRPDTFEPYLGNLIEYIESRVPGAEIIFNQTWAYEIDSTHSGFPYYDRDQNTMFQAIKSTYADLSEKYGKRIFPCGEAFQLARAEDPYDYAYGGASLCRDGYHANSHGCYILGAVWYETITGKSIWDNTFTLADLTDYETYKLRKAAHAAVTNYMTVEGTPNDPNAGDYEDPGVIDTYNFTLLNPCSDPDTIAFSDFTDETIVNGKSPDNVAASYTVSGAWANLTVDLQMPDDTSNSEALVFWLDTREIGDNYPICEIAFLDSKNKENIYRVRFQGDEKTLRLFSTADQSMRVAVASDINGAYVPKGFAGWVIVSLDEGVDYSQYDQVRIKRSGYPSRDNTVNRAITFDNFGLIDNITGFLRHNLYEDGVMTPVSGYTTPKVSVGADLTTAAVSFSAVASATKYDVNLYAVDENNQYNFVSSTETTSTSAALTDLTPGATYAIQVMAYQQNMLLKVSKVRLFVASEAINTSGFTMLNACDDPDTLGTYDISNETIANGYSPDNVAAAYTVTGEWVKFTVDLQMPADTSGQQALAFWLDLRDIEDRFPINNITFLNSADDSISHSIRKEADKKVIQLLSTADGSIQSVTANDVNGSFLPAGFVGWVIVSLDEEIDYSVYDQVQICRAGHVPATNTKGRTIVIDNIGFISNITQFLNHSLYEDGVMTPVQGFATPAVTVAPDSFGATVSFPAVESATEYIANLYTVEEDGTYLFESATEANEAEISVSGLTPEARYAVQILAYQDETLLQVSNVRVFRATDQKNAQVLNGASDLSKLTSSFTDTALVQDKTPDGTGLSMKTKKNGAVIFRTGEIDLSKYEAIGFWVGTEMDTWSSKDPTVCFTNAQDDASNVITEIIKGTNTGIYLVSTRDGSVTQAVSREAKYFDVPVNFKGYVIIPLADTATGTTSKIKITMSQWWGCRETENLNQPLYLDNLMAIRSVSEFISDSAWAIAPMTAESDSFAPQVQVIDSTSAELSWDPIDGADGYQVNLYAKNGDLLDYQSSFNTAETSAQLTGLTQAQDLVVQVLAKAGSDLLANSRTALVSTDPETLAAPVNALIDALGTITPQSGAQLEAILSEMEKLPDYAKTSVNEAAFTAAQTAYAAFKPAMLGATIRTDDSGDIRFSVQTPEAVPSGYEVASYGVLMLPNQFLDPDSGNYNPEAILELGNALCSNASTTSAAPGSLLYATLLNSSDHAGVRIAARAYVEYVNTETQEKAIVYSDTIVRSVYSIARTIAKALIERKDAIPSESAVVWTDAINEAVTKEQIDLPSSDPAFLAGADVTAFVKQNAKAISWIVANP